MPYSTAGNAQGTAFFIEGAPKASLTITAISLATEAVCTAANSLSPGDCVDFGQIAGMPEIFGLLGFVVAATGSQFTVNIDSSGFGSVGTGGAATAKSWTLIGNIHDYKAFSGKTSSIDVTNLQSKAMEKRPGLRDPGDLSANLDRVDTDPGQLLCLAAQAVSAVKSFKLTLADGESYAYKGFIDSFDLSGSVNGVNKGTLTVIATGDVTYFGVTTASGLDSRPRFGVAPAAASFSGATVLALLAPIGGSTNGGKAGSFALPTTTAGNAGWVAVVAANAEVTFTDASGGTGAWSGATSGTANYSGADATPTTVSETYTDPGTGINWRFFRENYVNAHPTSPATFTIS